VLILDEPTSSLDPKQRAEVRELIAGLKGDHTVVLSTHILPEVSEVADRVFIINRGNVMAVDTPANLAARLRAGEVVNLELATAGSTPDHVRAAFADLRGAGQTDVVASETGTLRIRIQSEVGIDLRSDAAALAVGRGWKLLGLASESLSLEQIFLRLTRDRDGKE
jgi:ABC-2 type transport system ATP-binding protein